MFDPLFIQLIVDIYNSRLMDIIVQLRFHMILGGVSFGM
jgi:hypothetical protein